MNIQLIIAVIIAITSAFGGWYVEHLRFEAFQAKTEEAGKAQEAQTQLIVKQEQSINQQTKDAYEKEIANLKSIYSRRVFINPSSGQVSSVPIATDRANETSPDQLFTQQCAETTEQLNALQQWIKDQGFVNGQ